MPLSPALTAWNQLSKTKGWELHDALARPVWRCRLGPPGAPCSQPSPVGGKPWKSLLPHTARRQLGARSYKVPPASRGTSRGSEPVLVA